MNGQDPQEPKNNGEALPTPEDFYRVLIKLIDEVSKDRETIRNLASTLANLELRTQSLVPRPPPKTIVELAQRLAIEQAEAVQAKQHAKTIEVERERETGRAVALVEPDNVLRQVQFSNELMPVWLQHSEVPGPDRSTVWLADSGSSDVVDYAPIGRLHKKGRLLTFLQLVGVAVVGAVVFVGISGWVHSRWPSVWPTVPGLIEGAPGLPRASNVAMALKDASQANESSSAQLQMPPRPPFPLPKTYGVFAINNGELTELQTLPVKIPDARILMSAKIEVPARTTVADGKLKFVVFKRDLVNSAPQMVSVRVVAQVARAMKFVGGKAVTSPIENTWRIRPKAYPFKVSPIESNHEMIVIQPESEFVFPSGRYALVLGGFGYDFAVAGPITSPEQCLEQVEALNGTVLSECP